MENRLYNSNNRAVIDEFGDVRQVTNYYPFGGVFSTTAYNRGDDLQPYKYNGKELDRTHGLDWYDYGARNYDAFLPMFTSLDPLCEKYYHISPYVYCANNPIKFIDPNGCKFTEAAWEWVNGLIDNISVRQEKNNAKIAENQATLDNGGLSKRKAKSLKNEKEKLEKENKEFSNIIGEIVALDASDQVYDIMKDESKNTSDPLGNRTENSWSTFNSKSGVFEIHLGNRELGMVAHELKHAYQFETGDFSISELGYKPLFYDLEDEMQAYERGALFGVGFNGTLPAMYRDTLRLEKGPKSVTKSMNYMQKRTLDRVANSNHAAFRYMGKTYNGIK